MDRPSTSKPRGVCKYYTAPRGCFAGKNCKFLHGESETLTPFDKAKTCIYYTKGFCKHGDKCWFLHVDSPAGNSTTAEQDAPQEDCSICLDAPSTYGLLSDCSHIFCLPCVRQWRDSQGKSEDVVESGNTKKCPLCRVTSRFIVPSSRFYPEGHPGKAKVIEAYKESTKRIPCKYFQETKNSSSPICPFGSECFYAHINDDGTPYYFSGGASRWMSIYKRRNRPRVYLSDAWDPVDHFAIDLFQLFRNSDITATLESIRRRLPDLLPDADRQGEDEELPENERQNPIEPAEEPQQRVPPGITDPDMPASFLALDRNMTAGHGTEEENMSIRRVLESLDNLDLDDDATYDVTYSPMSDTSIELALSESSYQDISDSDDEAQLTPLLVDRSERTTRSLPSSPRRSASSISFDRPTSRLSVSSALEAGPFVQSLTDLNILVSRLATPPIVTALPEATTPDDNNAAPAPTSFSLASSTASHPSPPAAATGLTTTHTAFNSSPLSPYARPFTPASTLLRPSAAFTTVTPSLTITAASSNGGGASGHYLRLPSPLPRSPRPSPPSPGRAFAGMDGESSMVIDLDEDDSADDEVHEDTDGAGRSESVDSGVLAAAVEDEGQQQRSAPPMVLVTATTTTSPSASGALPSTAQASSPSPQGAAENNNSGSGNNIERRLAALHDADPPFVTDGRGRVVWSRHGQQQQQQQQQQHRKSAANANSTRREGGVEPSAAILTAATTAGSNGSSTNAESSAQHAE